MALGTGNYTLSSGTLSAEETNIGYNGTGVFTQSGGYSTADTLYVGIGAGAGGFGTGTYNLSGGVSSVASLYLGDNEATGYYSLSGTGMLSVSNFEIITTGIFAQSGGYNFISGNLYDGEAIGVGNPGSGTYSLTSGTLSAANELMGVSETGSVLQSGGVNAIGNYLYVGGGLYSPGIIVTGTGSYSMSGPGLLSASNEIIGAVGAGTFTQSAGTNMISNSLYIGGGSDASGDSLTGTGTYTLTGGVLSTATNENIGFGGAGTFTQSGGSNTTGQWLEIGNSGAGIYNQSAGMNSVGALYLGIDGGAPGAYFLSETGTLSAGSETVGIGGNGTFTQSGGVNSIEGYLFDGVFTGGSNLPPGSYLLSGGALNATGEYIGFGGVGGVTQSGGSNTVAYDLYVGSGSGPPTAIGTYSLSGTGTLSSDFEIIGAGTAGSFSQSGGVNTVSNGIYVGGGMDSSGNLLTGTGNYMLTGGTLSTIYETVGFGTSLGTFTQSGGTNLAADDLYVGKGVNSLGTPYLLTGTGSFLLSGGTLSTTYETIGSSRGIGTFNQSGGSNSSRSIEMGIGTGPTALPLAPITRVVGRMRRTFSTWEPPAVPGRIF